jgi:hypothetical protein
VTNIFLFDYETRLQSWAKLRNESINQPLDKICVEVDKFWQRVPTQQHYLHTDFIKDWPSPWQLLSDNTYCYYARALGMIYTLLLLGNKNIDLVDAKDDNSNEVVLVLVDNAKYVLNYWPDMVVNNRITDFVITRKHDITPLYSKIGR